MQARNFTTNVPKILDLKSSSEQIFFRKLSLGAPCSLQQLLGNFIAFPAENTPESNPSELSRLEKILGPRF